MCGVADASQTPDAEELAPHSVAEEAAHRNCGPTGGRPERVTDSCYPLGATTASQLTHFLKTTGTISRQPWGQAGSAQVVACRILRFLAAVRWPSG